MKKSLAWIMCCGSLMLAAEQVDLNIRWQGGNVYQFNDNVLMVTDRSTTGGSYVLSPKMIPVDPGNPLQIKAQIKCENVTTRSQIYVRVVDNKGKVLKVFPSQGISKAGDWTEIAMDIDPGKLPAETAGILFMLQPAAGAASGTGTAYFRNITVNNSPRDAAADLRWSGGKFERVDNVIKVVDDSDRTGNYITAVLPAGNYPAGLRVSVEARCENTSGRTQLYLIALDAKGKRLKGFTSNIINGNSDWTVLSVTASEIPAGTVKWQLNMQPAAGAAAGVGTAYFRNLSIVPLKKSAMIAGRESTAEVAIKYGNVTVHDKTLKMFPFEHTPAVPRLEIMQSTENRASALQLISHKKINTVKLAVWDASGEFYQPLQTVELQEKNNSYIIDLEKYSSWRKLALEFPDAEKIELESLRFYRHHYPEENWQAYWIWYTAERRENETVFLRGEFELEKLPQLALFQGAVDDGGNIYINGRRVANILGRFAPPNINIVKYLRVGKNTVCATVHQARYAAGLLGELDMKFSDGSNRKFITDKSWKFFRDGKPHEDWMNPEYDVSGWKNCVELARPPLGQWGKVAYRLNSPRQDVVVSGTMLPDEIAAGRSYQIKIRMTAPAGIADTPVRLTLKRDGNLFYNWELGVLKQGNENEFACNIAIGKYLAAGEYDLEFSASGMQAVDENRQNVNHRKITVINPRRAEPPETKIAPFGNVPTLHINGKPYASIYSARGGKDLNLHGRLFNSTGIHLYHVYLTPQWENPEQPLFSRMDTLANSLLNGDPEAFFLVKISMRDATQPWMYENHPGDSVVFDDLNYSNKSKMSLASMARRRIFGDYIRDLITYVNNSPYADRVIGYIANEGEEGQWMHYWTGGNPEVKGSLSDYSDAMKEYFRNWLKKHYGNTEALRQAWQDDQVTFDSAEIPSREMRIAAGMGAFRDPVKNRPAIDYAFALSDVIAEGIIYYAKLIKETTRNKALTGALYGHLIDLGGHFLGEQVGYLRQKEAVLSPYVDMYLGPLHYGAPFRDQGGVGSFDMPSPDTLALYNKIWINENDIRTHLEFPAGYAHTIRTPYATNQVLAREVGKALCGRAGFYYFPLGEGFANWFDDPETVESIRELNTVTEKVLPLDRASASDIAVFISDESVGYLRQKSGSKIDRYMYFSIYQRENIGRIGAPFDEYLQFDIAHKNLKDYKFYIFLNPYNMSDEEKSAVERIAADKSKRILFLFAPAVMENSGVSLNFANKITNMDFKIVNDRKKLKFELKKSFGNLPAGHIFGSGESAGFVPVPQRFDELLAAFEDGTPAVVRRDNIYYAVAGLLPAEVLRTMAQSAAVEILSENNIAVYMCKSLLAYHSNKNSGGYCVKAPDGKVMKQVWPIDESSTYQSEFSWHNTRPESRIFLLKDK